MGTAFINEDFVVDSVATFLEANGHLVDSKLTTRQCGVDLQARHPGNGTRWLIEAKGQTSARPGSSRFDKGFDSSQVTVHVSRAFYQTVRLQGLHSGCRFGIALPDDAAHRKNVAAIEHALRKLDIAVFWVAHDGKVQCTHPI